MWTVELSLASATCNNDMSLRQQPCSSPSCIWTATPACMVFCVCLEAREGIGILGQDTMQWEHSPPAWSRCIPSAQEKPVGFYFAEFQKLSILLALYLKGFCFVCFTGSSLMRQKECTCWGGEKGKKKVSKEKQAKRGNQWDNIVVEAYPYLVICCKFESKNSSKRETCKFLSCIFKFASCVVSLL